jgi:hypothetical protein
VGAYPINDGSGTTITDIAATPHNGTATNSPPWVAGYYGSNDLNCGNSNGYFTSTYNSFLSGDFSIMALVKLNVTPAGYTGVVSCAITGNATGAFYLWTSSGAFVGSHYGIEWDGDAGFAQRIDSGAAWPAGNTPHLFGMTRSGTTLTGYLDGSSFGTVTTTNIGNMANVGNMYWGSDWYNGSAVDFVSNNMIYGLIWNRAITSGEVSSLWGNLFQWIAVVGAHPWWTYAQMMMGSLGGGGPNVQERRKSICNPLRRRRQHRLAKDWRFSQHGVLRQ